MIPVRSRLPDGRENPEYTKLKYAILKAQGRLPARNRDKANTRQREYRKTEKGKAIVDAWAKSEGHKKACKKRYEKIKANNPKKEKTLAQKAEAYANRIMRDLRGVS
jgi:hypothetical protein